MGYSDRYLDDEDKNPRWPAWRPLLGIFLGLFLVFASAVGAAGRGGAAGSGAELLGRLFGALLIGYGLPYLFAFRRAAIGWRIAAFLIIAPIAALTTLAQAGRDGAFMRGEAASLHNDMQAVLDGKQLTAGDATTPSGVLRNLLAALQANQAEYDAKLQASGILALLDAAALKRNPAILKDCGATERMRGELTRHRAAMDTHMATAREAIQKLPSRDVREGMLEGFDQSLAKNQADMTRRWELNGDALAGLGAMCKILARRHWREEGGQFAFTSDRDLSEFSAVAARYNTIYEELAALETKAQRQAQDSVRDIERMH